MLHIVIDDERHLRPEVVGPGGVREHYADSRRGLARLVELWTNSWLDPMGSVPTITLWLDHDLGGSDTTWPIVRWLQALYRSDIMGWHELHRVVVHSQNAVAAQRMYTELREITWLTDLIREPAHVGLFAKEGGGTSKS